jgi:hypothetical protein
MKSIIAIFLILFVISAKAQLPEPYKSVDQVFWIVKDLNQVTSGWSALGFTDVMHTGHMTMQDQTYRGNKISIAANIALARLGTLNVTWVQPAGGENAFTNFLSENNGDGVFALMHRFNSVQQMQEEEARLNNIGIATLQKGSIYTDAGNVTMLFMDTKKEGKYTLGFIHGPQVQNQETTGSYSTAPLNATFSQYAFVIKDPQPVSDYWAKIGKPQMEITQPEMHDTKYKGKKAEFAMDLGWHRHGDVVYEWCIPRKAPNVYEDFVKKYGEGVQHFGFNVDDMDKAIKHFESKGYKVSQSGGWGEKNKPGSGRFAYVDTERIGGVTIELLWNYK